MKTTFDLPDELLRTIKLRAVRENRRLEDVVADLLRRGLERGPAESPAPRRRVQLPLVRCAHRAGPGEQLTPERVAGILGDEEAQRVSVSASNSITVAATHPPASSTADEQPFAPGNRPLSHSAPPEQEQKEAAPTVPEQPHPPSSPPPPPAPQGPPKPQQAPEWFREGGKPPETR